MRFRIPWRERAPLIFLVLSVVATGGLAAAQAVIGGTVIRPALPHAHDDRPISFGNTRAAADVSILWETADASDHYLNAVVTGSSDFVVSQDAGIDWGVTGSNALRVQSADSTAPTEYFRARHDGTDVYLEAGAGRMKLEAEVGGIVDINDTDGDFVWSFQGTVNQDAQLWGRANARVGFVLTVDDTNAQNLFAVRAAAGGQSLILTDYDNRALNHGLDASIAPYSGNPVFRIQSDADPTGAGAAENMDYFHDQTDGHWQINEGDAVISPASGYIRNVQTVQSKVVSFDSASPTTIATVQDGDIVVDIWAEVTTIWDGNGTVDLGDDGNASGFMTDAALVTGSAGYKGQIRDARGAYLWDGAGSHELDHVYTEADTIDATVVQGTSSQGAMKVHVSIVRLK